MRETGKGPKKREEYRKARENGLSLSRDFLAWKLTLSTSSPGLFRPTHFLREKPWGRGCYAVYTKWPAVLYIFSVNLSNRKNRSILKWCRLRIGGGSWIIADPKNYRPVSLTSLTSKVMEHIHVVSYHISRHLSTNCIVSQHQHSFWWGLLCETQLRSSPSYTDGHQS